MPDARAGEPSLLPPSADELADAQVAPDVPYEIRVSPPVPVVPSPGLPSGLQVEAANNNLAIALHEGRLFLAFRTAPTHFASARARILVLSSDDLGRSWRSEASFRTGRDLREPFLLEVGGRLLLSFAEMGTRAYAFEPHALWRSTRTGSGRWTPGERWGDTEEVAWDFKVRNGRVWMTSYQGKHYSLSSRAIDARFRVSLDGRQWEDVGTGPVYRGGATEISFEFDRRGTVWAVTRNEDGDASGFGSHVASAAAETLGQWRFPARSNPSRFDSPRLFRHGDEIYMVARRDLGPPAGARFEGTPQMLRKLLIWTSYSLQPKRTALFRLDQTARRFEHVVDLPSAGDTAFPSVVRLSAHEFLIGNYSSGFQHGGRSWLWGQLNRTGIYFVHLRFERVGPSRPADVRFAAIESASPAARGKSALETPGGLDRAWPGPDPMPRRIANLGLLSIGVAGVVRNRRLRGTIRRLHRAVRG